MPKPKKEKRRDSEANAKELTTLATGTAASLTVALAAGATISPTAGALLAAGGAAASTFFGRTASWVRQRRERRTLAWYDEYVRGEEAVDPEAVEARLDAQADDAIVQETILEGARAVDEALADEVVLHLARLTRFYVGSGRGADAFFRGTRRLLSDLTGDEFSALRALVKELAETSLPDDVVDLRVETHDEMISEYTREGVTRLHLVGEGKAREWRRCYLGTIPFALRLFHLLKVNGLGADGVARGFSAGAGPGIIEVDVVTMRLLWAVIE